MKRIIITSLTLLLGACAQMPMRDRCQMECCKEIKCCKNMQGMKMCDTTEKDNKCCDMECCKDMENSHVNQNEHNH